MVQTRWLQIEYSLGHKGPNLIQNSKFWWETTWNLMTTRQRDDEELTKYAKHFKVARDLCKENTEGH